jgi:hypothetical protein
MAIAAYCVGLFLGALALTVIVSSLGELTLATVDMSLETRTMLAGLALGIVGAIEAVRGPWLFPHIAWAVPRSWASRVPGNAFFLVFGAVRGVAVFNHSPFASMHMWVVAVFLLSATAPLVVTAGAFAAGLAMWTLVYAVLSLMHLRERHEVFDRLTVSALERTRLIGRADGLGLMIVGLVILIESQA